MSLEVHWIAHACDVNRIRISRKYDVQLFKFGDGWGEVGHLQFYRVNI